MKKRNYNLIIGSVITFVFLAAALVGQFWTPYSPTAMDYVAVNAGPSLAHPMGTDNFGRDILSRVMNGSGSTFFVAVCTVGIGAFFGTIIGAVTGYFGGWLDNLIMRVCDIILSFPSVLLALIFISLLGPGRYNIIIALIRKISMGLTLVLKRKSWRKSWLTCCRRPKQTARRQ